MYALTVVYVSVDSSFHVLMDGVSLTKSGLRTVQWRPRRRMTAPLVSSMSASSMSNLDDVIDSVHAYVTRGLEDHGAGAGEGTDTASFQMYKKDKPVFFRCGRR